MSFFGSGSDGDSGSDDGYGSGWGGNWGGGIGDTDGDGIGTYNDGGSAYGGWTADTSSWDGSKPDGWNSSNSGSDSRALNRKRLEAERLAAIAEAARVAALAAKEKKLSDLADITGRGKTARDTANDVIAPKRRRRDGKRDTASSLLLNSNANNNGLDAPGRLSASSLLGGY